VSTLSSHVFLTVSSFKSLGGDCGVAECLVGLTRTFGMGVKPTKRRQGRIESKTAVISTTKVTTNTVRRVIVEPRKLPALIERYRRLKRRPRYKIILY